MNVTLMVPTLNRPDFIRRLIRYYADNKFTGRLLIGDSSSPEKAALCRAAATESVGRLDVRYVDLGGLDSNGSMVALVALVDTPYVAYIGDDDFIIPAALAECIDFLNAHSDYISACGTARNFELREDGAFGDGVMKGPYQLRSIEADSPMDRLAWLLFEYTPMIFSVHRAEAWKIMWAETGRIPDRSFGAELLPCCLSAVLGKSKQLDCLYLMRQTHGGTYHLPGFLDWIGDAGWAPSFRIFVETLTDHIVARCDLPRDAVTKNVKGLFHYYLYADRNAWGHKIRRFYKQVYYRFLPTWNRLQTEHPGLSAAARWANRAARRGYRFFMSPTEGIEPRLATLWVRARDRLLPRNRRALKGIKNSLANK